MRLPMTEALEAIADCFHPRERITGIRSLGSGNVNETFLVTHEGRRESGAFVLQRLNRTVFARPDLVMGCLLYTSPSPRDVEESRMPSSA